MYFLITNISKYKIYFSKALGYLCLLVKRTMTVIDIAQSRDTVFKGIQNNLLQRAGRELGALARYQLEAIHETEII